MTRFTRKSLPTTVNPEADLAALKDALQLARPPRVMECFDISNISHTHIVASMVRFKERGGGGEIGARIRNPGNTLRGARGRNRKSRNRSFTPPALGAEVSTS
jgi:hypothetical protein